MKVSTKDFPKALRKEFTELFYSHEKIDFDEYEDRWYGTSSVTLGNPWENLFYAPFFLHGNTMQEIVDNYVFFAFDELPDEMEARINAVSFDYEPCDY